MYKYINFATYKFNVIETDLFVEEKNDCSFFVVTDGKEKYTVKRLSFQASAPIPEFVFCKVVFKDDGSISLFQNPVYYIRQNYAINQAYWFDVIDITIKGASSFYVLIDENEIKHRLYFYNTIENHIIGDRIKCVVKRVTDLNGHLLLHTELFSKLLLNEQSNRIVLDVVSLETDKNDRLFFKLNSLFSTKTFVVPAYDFQLHLPIPEKLICELKSIDYLPPTLVQCRRDILRSYYSQNESYKFIIESITQLGKSKLYMLSDNLGLKHRIIDKLNKLSFHVHEEVVMVVKDFSAHQGNLILSRYANSMNKESFISAQDLFLSLGLEHLYECCFENLRLIEDEPKHELLKKAFLSHDNQSNNWITIYLSFISMSASDLNQLSHLLTVSIAINEWILSSNFLDSLPRFKREDTASKTKKEVCIIKAKQRALNLIYSNDAVNFVNNLIEVLERDYWLESKETYLETLKFIFIVDHDFIFRYASETTHLLGLLIDLFVADETEIVAFASIFGYKMKYRKRMFDDLLVTRDETAISKKDISSFVQILAAFILMKRSKNNNMIMLNNLVPLCRYLAILTNNNSLISSGIKVLTRKKIICQNLFEWKDVYTADFNKITTNINYILSNSESKNWTVFRKNKFSDSIDIENNQILYRSRSLNALQTNNAFIQMQLFEKQIAVAHSNINLPYGPIPFKDLIGFWGKIYYSNGANIENKNVVKVCFKSLHATKKNIAFFIIREGEYKGVPGVLTANQLLFKSEFDDTFSLGDEIYATINGIDSMNGHIQLSLTNYQLALRLTLDNTYVTKAVFMSHSNKHLLCTTQEGLQCSLRYNKKKPLPYQLGETYVVKVFNAHKNTQLPHVEVLGISDTKLDIDCILKEYLESYISIKPNYILDCHEREYLQSKFTVKELIYLIDYRLRAENSLTAKINYLQLAKLFAHLISDKLQCLYTAKLRFLLFIHNLIFCNINIDYTITDNTLSFFPNLVKLQSYKEVIDYIGYPNFNPDCLKTETDKQDPTFTKLCMLVHAYNTLDKSPVLLAKQRSIKEKIVNLLVEAV